MLLEFALLISALYALSMLLFSLVLFSAHDKRGREYRPTVSIIIAARNEEENIRSCLQSIAALTYPKDLLKVIVVDDDSTDSTSGIIREFTAGHPFITLITSTPSTSHLQGKVNALHQGIAVSTGEIIMFTDADCAVPPSWVENTMTYYANKNVGIVAGFISIRTADWFDAIQAIDWLILLSAAAATARLGFPVTAVGNNFSIRRSAYEYVGGYSGIPFSVTEDFALFHAVTKAGMKAIIPLDLSTTIESNACKGWKGLYGQRKRWFVGGRGMDGTKILAFGSAYALNLFVACGLLFLELPTWVALVAVKLAADYLLALPSLKLLGRTSLTKYWIPFQLYFSAYVLLFPLVAVLRPRVVWKERTFAPATRPAPNEKAPP